eukprot:CAMPEP_0197860784 /NCGR_PEP_ID=MMETSP1438-20131217/36399_1 /TAXON_ID=1461541 /ORGANISM="Pterosperma sp., Strain CCMP1384" /LENGTH=324 /DNA_ID=CAMNT_0043477765 /DNA_START=155 /DNA_END=1126 /DNA_ORIENTATION=+
MAPRERALPSENKRDANAGSYRNAIFIALGLFAFVTLVSKVLHAEGFHDQHANEMTHWRAHHALTQHTAEISQRYKTDPVLDTTTHLLTHDFTAASELHVNQDPLEDNMRLGEHQEDEVDEVETGEGLETEMEVIEIEASQEVEMATAGTAARGSSLKGRDPTKFTITPIEDGRFPLGDKMVSAKRIPRPNPELNPPPPSPEALHLPTDPPTKTLHLPSAQESEAKSTEVISLKAAASVDSLYQSISPSRPPPPRMSMTDRLTTALQATAETGPQDKNSHHISCLSAPSPWRISTTSARPENSIGYGPEGGTKASAASYTTVRK